MDIYSPNQRIKGLINKDINDFYIYLKLGKILNVNIPINNDSIDKISTICYDNNYKLEWVQLYHDLFEDNFFLTYLIASNKSLKKIKFLINDHDLYQLIKIISLENTIKQKIAIKKIFKIFNYNIDYETLIDLKNYVLSINNYSAANSIIHEIYTHKRDILPYNNKGNWLIDTLSDNKELAVIQQYGPSSVSSYSNDKTLKCSQHHGCHMLLCEHDNILNFELSGNINKEGDWFIGYCEICWNHIKSKQYSIREPLINGGWSGCYCSIECLQQKIGYNNEYESIPLRLNDILMKYKIFSKR